MASAGMFGVSARPDRRTRRVLGASQQTTVPSRARCVEFLPAQQYGGGFGSTQAKC